MKIRGSDRRRIRLVCWFATAALFFLLFPVQPRAAEGPSAGGETLLIRFTWKLYGVYAPLFVALDKGYYAAEGLAVTLAEGSGAETVIKLIAAGTDNVGFGPATVAAEAVSAGLPVEVIACYMPSTPIGLISFPDVPLRTPKDLEGRTLGLTAGETFSNMLEPLAKLNGVDLSKVKRVQLDVATRNSQFILRKLDVISVYLNNDLPLISSKVGVKFNALRVSDFGLKLLGASFFVNLSFAESHPETLRKLLRATAHGYADAFKDPAEATAILNNHMTIRLDPVMLETQVRETLAATSSPPGKPFGWQEAAAWQANLNLLHKAGTIREIKDLKLYYTNAFLQ